MTVTEIFINPANRLRSGWRLLIFLFIFCFLLFVISNGIRVAYAVAIQIAPNQPLGRFAQDVIFRTGLVSAALLAGFICTRWLEGLPARANGLSFNVPWLREFLIGSVLGIVTLALAALIATLAGGLTFSFPRTGFLPVVETLAFSGALFIIAALAEEALFRGYPLQTTARAGLVSFGVLLTSVLFAGTHMRNPNFSNGLPFLNLIIAGIWFAVAYLRTRSLWLPLGIHWAWNWALGSLFGLPVSGMSDLAPNPLFRGIDWGPAWLTGGSYGIEGGLASTVALVISTVFIWRTTLVSPTDDMKRLTSQENPTENEDLAEAVAPS